jgi:hypothetical protein
MYLHQLTPKTLEKMLNDFGHIDDIRYKPGLVSLAMSLFPKVGMENKANALNIDGGENILEF